MVTSPLRRFVFLANLIANPQFHEQLSVYIICKCGCFYRKICRSRDSLIPVPLFPIPNSKGRGFLSTGFSRTFHNPPFHTTPLVSQTFFSRKLTSCLVLRKKYCFSLYFNTIHHRFIYKLHLKPSRRTPCVDRVFRPILQ